MKAQRKRTNTSRWALGSLSALAVASLVTGCVGGGSQGGSDEVGGGPKYEGTVEFWTINLQKNFSGYIETMISDYEAEHPDVTIKWVDVPGQDMSTKLLAATASGDVPDLVNFSSEKIGLFGPSMTDLNTYFSEDERAQYQENLVASLDVEGKQAAMPWYNGGPPIATWNTSKMEGTGFDSDHPPETWDEALEMAQSVQDKTDEFGTNAMAYSTTMQDYGIDIVNEGGDAAAFNTPEAEKILEKFKAYYESGAIAPGVVGKDARSYPENFNNGRIAFMANFLASRLAPIESDAPDVYEELFVSQGVTGDSGKLHLTAQQTLGVPGNSDAKAAAAEFLKWVTSAENQLEFTKLTAIYPSTKSTLEDPFFTEISGDSPVDQARRVMVESAAKLTDGALGTGKDAEIRELFDEQVRAYIQGSSSASETLNVAEKQIDAALGDDS